MHPVLFILLILLGMIGPFFVALFILAGIFTLISKLLTGKWMGEI